MNIYKIKTLIKIMTIEDHLKGNVIKHEAVVNLETLRAFQAQHDEHIMRKCPDPSGATYNFKYIPSSCGIGVQIQCRCGEIKDITDYSVW